MKTLGAMSRGRQKRRIEWLRRESMQRDAALKLSGLSDNEVAGQIRRTSDALLLSLEWKQLRRRVLEKYGSKCMCCGVVPSDPKSVNVDHVKPRRFYPELALEESNLQVLCWRCNKRKGNRDTDYRDHPAAAFVRWHP